MQAKGFGPNIGVPTVIKIGSVEHHIILAEKMQLFTMPFLLSESSNILQIIPPHPVSPHEIDERNSDFRKIGIGLQDITFNF